MTATAQGWRAPTLEEVEPLAYSLAVIAAMFPKLSPRTLRHFAAKGALRTRKIGRQHFVDAAELAAFASVDVAKLPRVPR